MDVFTFVAICVVAGVVGSMWKSWLQGRRGEPVGGIDAERLARLEQRVDELQGPRDVPDDIEERLRVLEAIAVHRDTDLAREFEALEKADAEAR